MGVRDILLGESSGGLSLTEQYQAAQIETSYLKETIRDLEGAMDEEGWRRISALVDIEFTRRGLKDIIDASRAMYLINPLIQRSVDVTTFYTWAQGVTHRAVTDEYQEKIVKPMLDNDANREELYDHNAQVLTDVDQQVEGNLFFALPTNFMGEVSVRQVPTLQIQEIIRKPGDRAVVMYYRRCWTENVWNDTTGTMEVKEREELFPDWRYHPVRKRSSSGSLKINWGSPIIHAKSGGTKMMDFGVPATYSSKDWARAYKGFLEDWHTIVKSLARFSWKATGKRKPLEKLKRRLQSSRGTDEAPESNPAPAAGSMFTGVEGADLMAIPKTGATMQADDARASRLMISSGMNLPDTMLSGDAQQGALATAKTLDRPTELFMMHRQKFWRSFHQSIHRYSIDSAVRAGELAGKIELDKRTAMDMVVPKDDPTVDITFPPILEHNQTEVITGIVAAAPFIPEETTTTLALEALGVDNIKDAVEKMNSEREERKKEAQEQFSKEETEELEEAIGRLTEILRA